MVSISCQQVKTIDYESSGVKLIERAPPKAVSEALVKVRLLVAEEEN